MKCCRGGLRRGRRIRDRGRRVGRDGVASETRCRRTHSRLRTSSASSHDSSPPRATVERRVGEWTMRALGEWTMRASTRLASPTPARFAPGEEATRGRATAHEACTAEALIVMSGVEARRARACGEHCRVPFRRCQKSPPQCSCTRAVGFAIDKLRLTRSFVRRSRKCTESSRAISLEIREITVEKSVGFRGRAAATHGADQRAHTRVSTQEPLGSQERCVAVTRGSVFSGPRPRFRSPR
jgi:hypothetical protein